MTDASADPAPPDFTRRPNRYDADALRATYGPLRAALLTHTNLAARVRPDLGAINAGEPADAYLARHLRRAAIAALATGVVAALATTHLLALPTALLVAAAGGTGLLAALLGFATVTAAAIAYPRLRADYRRRRIDAALPHGVLHLYALSQSGVDLTDAIARVAAREDAFGPLAHEFVRVRDDLAWFTHDAVTALEHARNETRSEELEIFLDELLTVVQTGGSVPAFLAEEVENHLETARERQERLVEDVATYGELYVALVFAGPLFLFVVLVVIGLVTTRALPAMTALVYVGIPLAVAGFLAAFRFRIGPHVQRPGTGVRRTHHEPPPTPDGTDGTDGTDRIQTYRDRRHRTLLDRLRDDPRRTLTRHPRATLAVSTPLALLAAVALAAAGVVPTTAPLTDPHQLAAFVVLPGVILTLPYAVVHERRRKHGIRLRGRFPEAVDVLADALDNGVPVTDAFHLVSDRTTGTLARELRRVDRDLDWHATLDDALGRFDDRVGDPAVSRAVVILADVLDATHDVADVLRDVATHFEGRVHLLENRHTNVRPYVYAVTIGVLVFLAVVALFDTFFLDVVHEAAKTAAQVRSTPISVNDVPVRTYRRLLYHAAILQATGNGLLLGVLLEDRLATGAKYTCAYLVLTGVTLTALGFL